MNKPDIVASIAKPVFGSPAPWFKGRVLNGNPQYTFHTVAGRVIVLFFMGSAGHPGVKAALDTLMAAADRFDDVQCSFFGVSCDPADERAGRIKQRLPGVRYLLDGDRAISTAYGACNGDAARYEPHVVVLDRQLRVAARYSLAQAGDAIASAERLINAPAPDDWAPVLLIPRVLEPAMCRKLIQLYEQNGGKDSGFMRDVDGKTVSIIDLSLIHISEPTRH